MFQRLFSLFLPRPYAARSPEWPRVRAAHLLAQPKCQACGSRRNCVPHHIVPVHVDPTLELDPENLITLCEGPVVNCHALFGHCRDWQAWNVDVVEDCRIWREKIARRPRCEDA